MVPSKVNSTPGAPLLPRVSDLRETSVAVAAAVARAAEADGVASVAPDADLAGQLRALMWEPRYRPVRPGLRRAAAELPSPER